MFRSFFILLVCLSLSGCVGELENVDVVRGFEVNRYLGKWYEIARLDHSFERGMTKVTAEYSLRDDGGIRVINRGYINESGEWDEAEGKAYFVESPDVGKLKVSFFGPFYGGYNILALDKENYQYSLVAGPSRDYLWILARTPELDKKTISDLMAIAAKNNFPVSELMFIEQ